MSASDLYGKELFKKWMMDRHPGITIQFPTDEYSAYDALISDGVNNSAVEIKYRPGYSSMNDIIRNEGVMFEALKFNEFKQLQAGGANIHNFNYLMIFNDLLGYFFSITLLENGNRLVWTEKNCPKQTEFNDHSRMMKPCATIGLNDSMIRIDFNRYK